MEIIKVEPQKIADFLKRRYILAMFYCMLENWIFDNGDAFLRLEENLSRDSHKELMNAYQTIQTAEVEHQKEQATQKNSKKAK